jgi:hypothetical protein
MYLQSPAFRRLPQITSIAARSDFAAIESDLQFVMGQLARVPTRGDLAKAALGIIFCTAVFTDPVRLGRLALGQMTRAGPIIVAVIAALLSSPLSAREYRSREVTREFQREHQRADVQPALPTGFPKLPQEYAGSFGQAPGARHNALYALTKRQPPNRLMPRSGGLGLARGAGETRAGERGTWFDMCPGRRKGSQI